MHHMNTESWPEVKGVSTLDLGPSYWGMDSQIVEALIQHGFTPAFIDDPNYPGSALDLAQNQSDIHAVAKDDVTVYLEEKTRPETGRYMLTAIFIGPTYPRRKAYQTVEKVAALLAPPKASLWQQLGDRLKMYLWNRSLNQS